MNIWSIESVASDVCFVVLVEYEMFGFIGLFADLALPDVLVHRSKQFVPESPVLYDVMMKQIPIIL